MHVLGLVGVDDAWSIIKNFGTNGETAVKGIAGLGAMWFIVGGVWKATAKIAALAIHVVVAGVFMFALSSTNWLGTVAEHTIKSDSTGMGPVATQVYTPPGA